MYYYYYYYRQANYDEYSNLKKDREKLLKQLTKVASKLAEKENQFGFLNSIFDPKISIFEVNNKNMGHRYIGRFTVEDHHNKRKRYTVSIGKVGDFNGINDPCLISTAKIKAIEFFKRRHPELFLETK